jgi:hypothetical protein
MNPFARGGRASLRGRPTLASRPYSPSYGRFWVVASLRCYRRYFLCLFFARILVYALLHALA